MYKRAFLFILLLVDLQACSPEQRCYRNEDCESPMICKADGLCDYTCYADVDCGTSFSCTDYKCVLKPVTDPCANGACEDPNPRPCTGDNCEDNDACQSADDCQNGYTCKDGKCVVRPKVYGCPEGMASIENAYCIDRYEASRPDATATDMGSDSSRAVSKPGVMPWKIGDDNELAQAACEASGKRLCSPAEWELSCRGVNGTAYGYGDQYDPLVCNGLDTYGRSGFHLMPTGSFADCNNGWGVYDMSGNLWEHTANGSGKTVRGGAYNCVDSQGNHKCSYIPQTWTPLALGFRCCSELQEIQDDDAESASDEVPEARNGHLPDTPEIRLAWNDAAQPDTATDAQRAMYAQNERFQAKDDVKKAQAQNGELGCADAGATLALAEQLWQEGETAKQALELLKRARNCHPDNVDIQRAVGIAYARMENYHWALKSLTALHAKDPADCNTDAWIAWIYIQMGMMDEARPFLSDENCSDTAMKGRIELVGAFHAMTQNDREAAKRQLALAYGADELTQTDSEALKLLQAKSGSTYDPNFAWRAELAAGYTSNALSGSPTDPRMIGKDLDSAFLDYDVRVMLDPWRHAFARSIFEVQANGEWLFSDDSSDSSYTDVILRPGIVLSWERFKLGIYYRPEFLITSGGDIYDEGPLLSYMSHRMEFDLELLGWLYLFGGYGHRTFRQRVRTRDEFDLGAGGYHSLGSGFALTWGATYRHWFSTGDMYDLNGMNVSLALDYRIRGVLLRLNGSYAMDDYADSKGYFDPSEARRDNIARGSFQVWSPEWYGLKVGAQFKASRRWSKADEYDYADYRGTIAVRWTGALDFYAPSARPDDYSSLPWDLEHAESSERIRDMIQQDEDLQRNSSCLQN